MSIIDLFVHKSFKDHNSESYCAVLISQRYSNELQYGKDHREPSNTKACILSGEMASEDGFDISGETLQFIMMSYL